MVGQAIVVANAIGAEATRSSALAALAPYLAPGERPLMLGEALAAAKAIDNECDRSRVLAALAPYLTPGQLGEALAAAKAIDYAPHRSSALAALAPHLAPNQLGEALAAAKAIGDVRARSIALAALVGQLPSTLQVDPLLALIDAVGTVSRRASLDRVTTASRPTFELGGQGAMLEVRRAISDVCRWYP